MNLRPLDPQSSALTKLRHSPCLDDGGHPSGAWPRLLGQLGSETPFSWANTLEADGHGLQVMAEPHDQLHEPIKQVDDGGDDKELEVPRRLEWLYDRRSALRALAIPADLVVFLELCAGLTPSHRYHLAEKSLPTTS